MRKHYSGKINWGGKKAEKYKLYRLYLHLFAQGG